MPPYAIADVTVQHVPVEIGLPVSRMRGNAHGYTAFAMECFIDELVAKHDLEPLSFRMAMLGEDARLAECLQRAAPMADSSDESRVGKERDRTWRYRWLPDQSKKKKN